MLKFLKKLNRIFLIILFAFIIYSCSKLPQNKGQLMSIWSPVAGQVALSRVDIIPSDINNSNCVSQIYGYKVLNDSYVTNISGLSVENSKFKYGNSNIFGQNSVKDSSLVYADNSLIITRSLKIFNTLHPETTLLAESIEGNTPTPSMEGQISVTNGLLDGKGNLFKNYGIFKFELSKDWLVDLNKYGPGKTTPFTIDHYISESLKGNIIKVFNPYNGRYVGLSLKYDNGNFRGTTNTTGISIIPNLDINGTNINLKTDISGKPIENILFAEQTKGEEIFIYINDLLSDVQSPVLNQLASIKIMVPIKTEEKKNNLLRADTSDMRLLAKALVTNGITKIMCNIYK